MKIKKFNYGYRVMAINSLQIYSNFTLQYY